MQRLWAIAYSGWDDSISAITAAGGKVLIADDDIARTLMRLVQDMTS